MSPPKRKKKKQALKYIQVIADYGAVGDLAFAEVRNRLRAELQKAGVERFDLDTVSVPAFDTYATGFQLAQLAINSPLGKDHIFYVNTAPRRDKRSARINNEGEGLVYAKLHNGVQIVAVNSGYSLTLIKPFTKAILALNVSNAGSQFRSRDIFPQVISALLTGDTSILGKDVSATVPDAFPKDRVVYTDGYGNLKCSVDPKDIVSYKGKRVHLRIEGSDQIPVLVGAGIFDVVDGDFCFAKGSSGWTLPNGLRMEFAEVIKRSDSAAKAFNYPKGGHKLVWRPTPK